jgi:hypothetical protein
MYEHRLVVESRVFTVDMILSGGYRLGFRSLPEAGLIRGRTCTWKEQMSHNEIRLPTCRSEEAGER